MDDPVVRRLIEKTQDLLPGDLIDFDSGWLSIDERDLTQFGRKPKRWTIFGTTGQFDYRINDLMEYLGYTYGFEKVDWRRRQQAAISRIAQDFLREYEDDYRPAVAWASNSTSSPLGHSGEAKMVVGYGPPRIIPQA